MQPPRATAVVAEEAGQVRRCQSRSRDPSACSMPLAGRETIVTVKALQKTGRCPPLRGARLGARLHWKVSSPDHQRPRDPCVACWRGRRSRRVPRRRARRMPPAAPGRDLVQRTSVRRRARAGAGGRRSPRLLMPGGRCLPALERWRGTSAEPGRELRRPNRRIHRSPSVADRVQVAVIGPTPGIVQLTG